MGNTTTPGISATITLDTTAPVLTLIGSSSLNILQGDVYADDGATASDNLDGDISARIVTTGLPVDKYTEGDVQVKADDVYRHVYRVYPVLPSPYYHSTAVLR